MKTIILLAIALLLLAGCDTGPKCLESHKVIEQEAGWRWDCGMDWGWWGWHAYKCQWGHWQERSHIVCDRYEAKE